MSATSSYQPPIAGTLPPIGYDTITWDLSPEDKEQLAAKLDSLPDKEANISALAQACNEHSWDATIFHNTDYPLYALQAVKVNAITQLQFGTILQYWGGVQYHEDASHIQAMPLYTEDGLVDEETKQLMKETFKPAFHPLNPTLHKLLEHDLYLSDEDLDILLEVMQDDAMPLSERQTFITDDIQPDPSDEEIAANEFKSSTVSQALIRHTAFNLFSRIPGKRRMFPSFGLYQSFLNVKYGTAKSGKDTRARKIVVMIGPASIQTIRTLALHHMSPIGVHFPGINSPHTADDYAAPWYDYPHHDRYHLYIASAVTFEHHEISILIFDEASECAKGQLSETERESITPFAHSFLEMNHPEYRSELALNPLMRSQEGDTLENLFWSAFYRHLPQIKNVSKETRDALLTKIIQRIALAPSLTQGPTDERRRIMKQDAATIKDARAQGIDTTTKEFLKAYDIRDIQPLLLMEKHWKQMRGLLFT